MIKISGPYNFKISITSQSYEIRTDMIKRIVDVGVDNVKKCLGIIVLLGNFSLCNVHKLCNNYIK